MVKDFSESRPRIFDGGWIFGVDPAHKKGNWYAV